LAPETATRVQSSSPSRFARYAYGPSTRKARHRFEELRDCLRDEKGGVERVIRALDYLRKQSPHRADIRLCAAYFRKHRHRMKYVSSRVPEIGGLR
jgi:hypothetical protein